LNKSKSHIFLSWLLLLFFVAGQGIVYAHQHDSKFNATSVGKSTHDLSKHENVHEKCTLCDQMHHTPIDVVQPFNFAQILATVEISFCAAQHHYKGKTLVHADGLSPPNIV